MRLKREIREKKILEKRLLELENEALTKQKQYKDKFGDPVAAPVAAIVVPKPKVKALTKRVAP